MLLRTIDAVIPVSNVNVYCLYTPLHREGIVTLSGRLSSVVQSSDPFRVHVSAPTTEEWMLNEPDFDFDC